MFNLTLDLLTATHDSQKGRCYWFNVPFTYEVRSGPTLVTVDRIDNNVGYVADNIVLACDAANRGRREYDDSQFAAFVALLRESVRG